GCMQNTKLASLAKEYQYKPTYQKPNGDSLLWQHELATHVLGRTTTGAEAIEATMEGNPRIRQLDDDEMAQLAEFYETVYCRPFVGGIDAPDNNANRSLDEANDGVPSGAATILQRRIDQHFKLKMYGDMYYSAMAGSLYSPFVVVKFVMSAAEQVGNRQKRRLVDCERNFVGRVKYFFIHELDLHENGDIQK
ncbi:hypothetical protein GGI12_005613, partial [Dipsacomyces acuminosporus]